MKRWISVALLAFLAACGGQDDRICEKPLLATDIGGTSPDACVHRAAYRYARAAGTNSEIARAAVAECDDLILKQARGMSETRREQLDRKGTEYSQQDYEEGFEYVFQFVKKEAEDEALRRIVQAKAGRCDPSE